MRDDASVVVDLVDPRNGHLQLSLADEAALYTFLHEVADEIRPAPDNVDRYFEALLHHDLARAHVGGGLVGFAFFPDLYSSPRPELEHLEPITLIDTIVVAPHARGRQVGRLLHDAIVQRRPGTTPVTRAFSSDTVSMAFLNRLGYRQAITVPGLPEVGEPVIYLTR